MTPSTSSQEPVGSSASSVLEIDINEGILIQDADQKDDTVESDDVTVTGHVEQPNSSEENKRTLRDQLRKTLSQSKPVHSATRSRRDITLNEQDIIASKVAGYEPRSYFVLTDAGKPVFFSRTAEDDVDNTTSMIGVMQALISVFLDDNDKLRCINAGRTRINFLLRPPLYYVCISSWGEPESVTRTHLEYLHLQILSVVTASQLRRIFERRTNFDLRRLLNGAESFLLSLLKRLEFDFSMTLTSLHCLRLRPSLRKRIADALVPQSKAKDILYIMLVAWGQVVTLIRPRKHSIHPADIHIILNTIHSPSIYDSPAPSSWIPVCLPKYNSQIFVNAYISFLRREDEHNSSSTQQNQDCSRAQLQSVALVCISSGGDMDLIRGWCNDAAQKLESEGTLDELINSCQTRQSSYVVSDLGIPGLRHFIYKSRRHVQITMPAFEDPYEDATSRRRLVTLYQILHDAIHAKSGQDGTLKLQYIRTDKESLLGWITQPFEIYLSLSHRLPKTAAINAANAVVNWIKKEETQLFLQDAPVF
ncbi:hypothetical protein AMATHDRAFT_186512 [Amanita thiersii Skay4041]|uniref:Vacuolar fusion protein MON1 n=1 Tax=Amanita thiersii Skay4041 TaxID=703135 RepID=A0A2A9NSC3_9AGAR|nr:hypothetical protein AMATHDRAFT_186512 [Amanita thiersii Skay4041]